MKAQWTLTALGILLAGMCASTAAQDETKKAVNPPATGNRPTAPNRVADERAIREAGAAFVRAYDAGDARAIAALLAEDAEVIDEDGHAIQGRAAIAELFASTFAAHPGETIEVAVDSIRFLGPDSAKEEGRTRIVPARNVDRKKVPNRGGIPQHSRYTVLYVRQSGRWLQSSVREHPDREITPHERLEPLSWMVGEWVDEGSASVVLSSTRWSDDGNSLIRDFTIQIRGKPSVRGTQRIGWDPLKKQIVSWVFDSEGGHGEGLWAHDVPNNRWVVKASGVLRDGRTATATQVYTVISPDLVRWKSVDRTDGDRVEPDADELMMVRKPPRPR